MNAKVGTRVIRNGDRFEVELELHSQNLHFTIAMEPDRADHLAQLLHESAEMARNGIVL